MLSARSLWAGAALVLSLAAPAFAYDVTTYAYDSARTGFNSQETTLGLNNAASLHVKWTVALSSVSICTPVVADNLVVGGQTLQVVYTASEHGDVYALNAATGAIVWQRNLGSVQTTCVNMPDKIFGVSAAFVIDRSRNRLYAAGGDGNVYALDLSTGATQPGWPLPATTDPAHEHVYSALTLAGNTLYACTASYCDIIPYHGKLTAFDITGPSVRTVWLPLTNPSINGGGMWGPGGVSVDPSTRDIFVATGNSLSSPENMEYCENVCRLDSLLNVKGSNYPGLTGGDVDFGATPVVFTPPSGQPLLAVENKSGIFLTYNRDDITSGPRQRIQVASSRSFFFNGEPAYSPVANIVYVSNSTDSNTLPLKHGLNAFTVQANGQLAYAWQKTVGNNNSSVPAASVANGVVYYAAGSATTLYAFNAATGAPLWTSGSLGTSGIYQAPMVANGQLYIGTWNKQFICFAP